ncbi:MAG TPA: phosphatase PAP2 family protein [Methanophagales archaeon]|nr:phosphatase PAP2 family protein [Methanophagales archaeon]
MTEARQTKKQFIKECRFYILLPLLVLALCLKQASIQHKIAVRFGYYDYTALISAINPDFALIFQKGIYTSLTYLMTFTYILIYPCALIFTIWILIHYRETLLFKRVALMFSLNYLIAFPFFMLFNVSTTGATLPGVEPLIYEEFPRICSAITAIDPLDNCFPSLHVAMVFSAFLIMCGTNYRRYKIFIYFALPATVFAVLYLGIHWLIDVFAGIALALFTYYLAKSFCNSSQIRSSGASDAL